MKLKIKGVIVPPVTPFDEHGRINTTVIKPLTNFFIERGVSGLFPGGTTGEGLLLSIPERCRLAEAFVEAAGGRIPVIIHTGAITTAEAIELTRHAQDIGAQAAAMIPPFYYHHSEEALQRYFETIAKEVSDFPLYLYNIPSRTGNNLSTALVTRLIEQCPNVIGMKDSSGQLDTLFTMSSSRNGTFNTATGSDGQILTGLALGFDACVSGNANVVPELMVDLYRATTAGNLPLARKLQAKVDAVRQILEDGADLSLFKGILARRGLDVGYVRPPLLQAADSKIEQCWQALNDLNLELIN